MSLPPRAPRSADDDRFSDDPPLPRWVFWLALPGIVAPILIFGFILVTQRAHDPERCPFRELSLSQVGPDAQLAEEARSCLSRIEEHRYSVLRGTMRRVIGERRFDAQAFTPDHYQVHAALTTQGEVQVIIHNDGHDDVLFREGSASEHDKGVSFEHRSAAHPGERP